MLRSASYGQASSSRVPGCGIPTKASTSHPTKQKHLLRGLYLYFSWLVLLVGFFGVLRENRMKSSSIGPFRKEGGVRLLGRLGLAFECPSTGRVASPLPAPCPLLAVTRLPGPPTGI